MTSRSSLRAGVAALAFALLPLAPARADTVRLKDGQVLEGKVTERDRRTIVVHARYGEVVVARDDVASITRGVTPDDEYEVELRVTVLDDPDDVERLARWCRERGMTRRALDLEERARALREEAARLAAEEEARARAAILEARREGVRDGEGIYRLALWAEGEGYARAVVERLLREALLADPQHAKARVADELRRSQAAAAAALAEAQRARDAAQGELAAARAARREAEAREAAAEALQARLAEAERTIDARLDEARRREANARDHEQQARADAGRARDALAAAEQERRRAQEERARAEEERRRWERERRDHTCACGTCG